MVQTIRHKWFLMMCSLYYNRRFDSNKMEGARADRELITQLLHNLPIDNLTVTQQAQLMQALGFESDVPFAKSLFSDTLALKYQQNKYVCLYSEDKFRNFWRVTMWLKDRWISVKSSSKLSDCIISKKSKGQKVKTKKCQFLSYNCQIQITYRKLYHFKKICTKWLSKI